MPPRPRTRLDPDLRRGQILGAAADIFREQEFSAVSLDAVLVLVDAEHVYQLSDQKATKAFAGKKVTVVGTLDPKTSTITVTAITPS